MSVAVFDTNVLSYVFNRDSRGLLYHPFFDEYTEGFISFATIVECRIGALKRGWGNKRRTELETFLSQFTVYHTDNLLCNIYTQLVCEVETLGRPIETKDAWIASTALALRCPLVTHNVRHFQHIKGLTILTSLKN